MPVLKLKPIHPDMLFNGFVGANVAFAYQQIGLFDVIKKGENVTIEEIAVRTDSHLSKLQGLLKAGEALGYFHFNKDGTMNVTEMGEELRQMLGYFTWSVGGYGEMFRELGNLTKSARPWGHLRNEGMVALGADMNNRSFMEKLLFDVLDHLHVNSIADFGCGNGGRLITWAERYSHINGVGVDISADAIGMAEEQVKMHGLENRLKMVCANVLDTFRTDKFHSILEEVELVSSFMMLHDLYNISDLRETLFDRLREAFPNVKYFLIADTVQKPSLEELEQLPIFNVGYELLHNYMGVYIPKKEEYDELFARAGLAVEKCIEFGTPYTYLYLLKV
ncbi:SAM-dependent methyltransferase [Chengkuizengella marina]|uniref:Methyltransferase domain-containing protein n=1 Tax=Chengkuizengella marina TaxID=2507566 RepID=A0A6N9Q2V9_9BACL|nr:class I SAM-dependent methyltransferase [Chengkuizengella marina]NBI29135.1 methyltransferase domain-containing protein [Chengkuizengella marina]